MSDIPICSNRSDILKNNYCNDLSIPRIMRQFFFTLIGNSSNGKIHCAIIFWFQVRNNKSIFHYLWRCHSYTVFEHASSYYLGLNGTNHDNTSYGIVDSDDDDVRVFKLIRGNSEYALRRVCLRVILHLRK